MRDPLTLTLSPWKRERGSAPTGGYSMATTVNPHQRANQRLQLTVVALIIAGAGCEQAGQPAAKQPPSQQTSTAPVAAKPPGPTTTAPSADGPRMTFKQTWIDLGRFSEAVTQTVTFEFTNTGNEVLHIRDIRSSCYCTVATLPKLSYQPGESGAVDVEFDPPRAGVQDRSVSLLTNARPQETISLRLTADIEPFVTFDPSVLALGILPLGKEHRATVSVSCADKSFEIESIVSTNRYVTAELIEAGGSSAAPTMTIELVFTPDAPWGPKYFAIEVTVVGRPTPDAEPLRHTSSLRVAARIFGELVAEPDTFRFSTLPGSEFEKRVELRRRDGRPFNVLDARASASSLASASLTVRSIAPDIWELLLTATAIDAQVRSHGLVLVKTDVPGEETIEITVFGVVHTPGG